MVRTPPEEEIIMIILQIDAPIKMVIIYSVVMGLLIGRGRERRSRDNPAQGTSDAGNARRREHLIQGKESNVE